MDESTIRIHLRETFSTVVNLPPDDLYGSNLTLSEIMARATGFTNSVDLMEAFARCAKSTKQRFGIRLRLPALPLDTRINEVIELFVAQALEATQEAKKNAAE